MIWILLVVFQFKHFIADYPLQGKYMLGKFKDKEWQLPLAAHCGVHFLFTFVISFLTLYNNYRYIKGESQLGLLIILSTGLALIDFKIHFIMDRIKASPKMLGQYQNFTKKEFEKEILPLMQGGECYEMEVKSRLKSNTLFWWSLGLDQMVHHLTDILIIYLLMSL
jgi:hypothetical protein